MFNFNKKEEDYDSVIFENLSINQKMSLLNLLFFIARCDGEIKDQPNEIKFLSSYFTMFRIQLKTCQEYMSLGGKETTINDLVPLTRKQKEYLLITSWDLSKCDGRTNETEITTIIYFFEKIGINEDESLEIIRKAELFAKSL